MKAGTAHSAAPKQVSRGAAEELGDELLLEQEASNVGDDVPGDVGDHHEQDGDDHAGALVQLIVADECRHDTGRDKEARREIGEEVVDRERKLVHALP